MPFGHNQAPIPQFLQCPSHLSLANLGTQPRVDIAPRQSAFRAVQQSENQRAPLGGTAIFNQPRVGYRMDRPEDDPPEAEDEPIG